MTNARQIKQVFRPLTERNSDLIANGNGWLWIRPVRHVALRVLIERTSHANYASPRMEMPELFFPDTKILQSIGDHCRFYSRPTGWENTWEWSDPTMVDDLIATIENDMLPILRTITTLDDFAMYLRKTYNSYHLQFVEDHLIMDIALGRLDAARKICIELLPKYREDKYKDWWLYQNLRSKVMTVAKPLLADDRQELARILHGWEAANVRGTKVEPHWQPTPFPLECA